MFHHTPSVFRPVVAKYVYQTFAGGGKVWDPCAGYGGRLLGAMAAGVSTYIGTDIEPTTVAGNQAIIEHLGLQDRCYVVQQKAEEYDPGGDLDLVFTSPPYYDLETYGGASSEAGRGYGSPQGWVQAFLRPVMRRAVERLKPGGHLVLNLPQKPILGLRLDLEAVVQGRELGLSELPTLWMPVRTFKGTMKGEPLLVWKKEALSGFAR
jgi:tRNA G10  N-methylase Trm11